MAVSGNTFNISLSGLKKILSGIIVNSQPSGLTKRGLITYVSLSEGVWTALPATPLTDRNAILIQNRSGGEMVFNYDNTAPTDEGITIINGGEAYRDIKQTIPVYGMSVTGNGTITVKVEEIS